MSSYPSSYLPPLSPSGRTPPCARRDGCSRPTQRAQFTILERLERLFREYGWVVLFALLCYGLYYRVHMRTVEDLHVLRQMHTHLLNERQKAYQIKAELTLDWQSKGDFRSRELILMRELGLVPKGFKKIVFTLPSSSSPSSSPSLSSSLPSPLAPSPSFSP